MRGRLLLGLFALGLAVVTAAVAGGTLEDLIDAMRTGHAYVNLHTNDGVGLPNTGAGDFPGGEIRANISTTD